MVARRRAEHAHPTRPLTVPRVSGALRRGLRAMEQWQADRGGGAGRRRRGPRPCPSIWAVIVYDAGALIAAERGQRPMLAFHTHMLQRRLRPVVPAAVLAQVWRGGPQASLSRVLSGCRIEEGFAERDARRIGAWLARSETTDVVDAHVVAVAGNVIYTEDVGDLRRIAGVADQPPDVLPVPKGL